MEYHYLKYVLVYGLVSIDQPFPDPLKCSQTLPDPGFQYRRT